MLEKHKITNSRPIRLLRQNFSLSNYQKSILVGTLLGDGSLYSDGWSKNYRLQIAQGNDQKDYLLWKFNQFRNCCVSEPSYQECNKSWRIRTISHKEFNHYAEMFYFENRKIIPQNISEHLDSLAMAIWFMDDGAKGPHNIGYILNTQSFTYVENEFLRSILINKFSLKSISIHKDKKWFRLYIRRDSENDFKNLINQYVIPSMRYKLLTP